mmetsp:Transcript_55033/g.132737  ORF Transcript_55033/g.132737 Transcript_55033/m.132737 type:complete len:205 (-) Transcript_55033:302-916(-)
MRRGWRFVARILTAMLLAAARRQTQSLWWWWSTTWPFWITYRILCAVCTARRGPTVCARSPSASARVSTCSWPDSSRPRTCVSGIRPCPSKFPRPWQTSRVAIRRTRVRMATTIARVLMAVQRRQRWRWPRKGAVVARRVRARAKVKRAKRARVASPRTKRAARARPSPRAKREGWLGAVPTDTLPCRKHTRRKRSRAAVSRSS